MERPTASEAIWGNLELMGNILGFLHEPGQDNHNPKSPNDSSKKDILAACLVSKSFFLYPALALLWRHLDPLLPVLRLFPTFQQDQSGQWSLTGKVCDDHVQRVLFYSRLIRSIRITSLPTLTNTLIILCSRMHPVQPFLPLTELIVDFDPFNPILHPILFIMPLTLTSIVVNGISASRVAVASLLQYLSSNGHSLKHLSLTGSIDDAFLCDILKCTTLRSLTLTSSESVFSAHRLGDLCDSLTSLETLSLNIHHFNPALGPIPRISLPPVIFTSLVDLALTGDLLSISGILSTLKAPQLHEISVSFSSQIDLNTPDAATFATCVAQVATINGPEGNGNLRSVKILHTHPSTCADMSAFDSLDALRTTIQVLHLQPKQLHIAIDKDHKNPFETNLIYPALVDLRIFFKRSLNKVGYPPTILDSLARSCPNLKTLHISIGVRNDDQIEELSIFNADDMPAHGLQNLVFHHLPPEWNFKFTMTLGVALARYINFLFPILSSAEYCEQGRSEEATEWWTGVQEMLKMCQGKESARRLAMANV